jgi:nucleotide-binding universal stress UspA family protein
MIDKKFRVLLYSDGSHQAFSAAVYTATLLKKMPNMHLTVIQVQESSEVSIDPKAWDNWLISSDWKKRILDDSDQVKKDQYERILAQTNAIFKAHEKDISFQIIYSNPSISETIDAIIDYASQSSAKLIIMGTRGLTALKGLIFGCMAHNLLNRSPVPVLLVKKLPDDFITSYCYKFEPYLISNRS